MLAGTVMADGCMVNLNPGKNLNPRLLPFSQEQLDRRVDGLAISDLGDHQHFVFFPKSICQHVEVFAAAVLAFHLSVTEQVSTWQDPRLQQIRFDRAIPRAQIDRRFPFFPDCSILRRPRQLP